MSGGRRSDRGFNTLENSLDSSGLLSRARFYRSYPPWRSTEAIIDVSGALGWCQMATAVNCKSDEHHSDLGGVPQAQTT